MIAANTEFNSKISLILSIIFFNFANLNNFKIFINLKNFKSLSNLAL